MPRSKFLAAPAPLVVLLTAATALSQTPPAPPVPSPIDLINREVEENGLFQFDYGIPSSPALNLLGQPEDKVTAVNGLKPFILQLPRILGADAEGGQSVSLDVAPAWLFGDRSQSTYGNYVGEPGRERERRLYRILNRTHVGVALYEGLADTDPSKARPSRLALGISTSLLDSNDPLMARLRGEDRTWERCIVTNQNLLMEGLARIGPPDASERYAIQHQINVDREEARVKRQELAQLLRNGAPEDGPAVSAVRAEIDRLETSIRDRRDQIAPLVVAARTAQAEAWGRDRAAQVFPNCLREANLVARYGASLGLGAGALWQGEPGRLRDLSHSGWVFWAAFRRPLGGPAVRREADGSLKVSNYWMIGFSGRASFDEIVTTDNAATPFVRANVFDGWGGIEHLSESSRFAFQLGYQVRDSDGALAGFDRERLRYFLSYSQRLSRERDGIWLRVGYGHARSSDDEDEALSVSLIFAPPAAANLFGTN